MKKRGLVIFSLLVVSVLFIAGCQQTVGRNPVKLGAQPNGDYICSDGATILPAGRYTLAEQECGLAISAKKSVLRGQTQQPQQLEENPCVGLLESDCKSLGTVYECKAAYDKGKYLRCEKESFNYWADSAGNQDGLGSKTEREYLELKLRGVNEFYVVTQGPSDRYRNWKGQGTYMYLSQEELRADYEGISIRGEVGILKVDGNGKIIGAWSSSGGGIATGEWEEESTPIINYNEEMDMRKRETLENN